MEQKGTLWIIAAVGIFLLAVLLPAIILFKPDTHKVQTTTPIVKPSSGGWIAAGTPSPAGSASENETAKGDVPADKIDFENPAKPEAGETQSTERSTTQVGDMTVFAQNATVYGIENPRNTQSAPDGSTLIDLNALRSSDTSPSDTVMPKNETSAKSMETARQTSRAPQTEQAQYSAAKSRSAATVSPTQKPSSAPKTAVTKNNASKGNTAKKSVTPKATQKNTAAKPKAKTSAGKTQYWVQAASFANKNGADAARSVLDENKISADVFTYKDGKGKVFYRVRIGPYVTKSEAEYWRTRVGQINDFKSGESYITQTSSATD
ncbi:SPOR domain-containing protein [Treponema socranskii]|uniref:SPOR domain-containing protein n=1 Tax=Treponema socranskii TaxID=53419 RepID=UPI0023F437C9|nr:SPOR domain-containing protein [Treponema socranskii]